MRRLLGILTVLLAFSATLSAAQAQQAGPALPDRVMGKERAPVLIEEYVSLSCPHCGDFYLNTLPQIEKKYVDTGKVRIVLRDFPIDGASLKAAALARCMPAEEFYPFIRILYENQKAWVTAADPGSVLTKYAQLGGIDEERAKFCLNDPGMQQAIIAERDYGANQYGVDATPTFVFNNGAEKMQGAGDMDSFSKIIDRMLAHAK